MPSANVETAATAVADPIKALYHKITWKLIPFLCFCYLAAYLDRINIGFAKLQMLDQLHFSETAFGLGAGLFFVGYILFEVPSNLVLEKVGAKIWIARIMITWGLSRSARCSSARRCSSTSCVSSWAPPKRAFCRACCST
jgi:sugar phosphate permease